MFSQRLLWLDDNKSAVGLFPCNYQADIRIFSNRLLWLDDNKSAVGLFPCSHQADIRMFSQRLLWLDDNKSVAGLFPCNHQADIKMRSALLAVASRLQFCYKMTTSLLQAVLTTCRKSLKIRLHQN